MIKCFRKELFVNGMSKKRFRLFQFVYSEEKLCKSPFEKCKVYIRLKRDAIVDNSPGMSVERQRINNATFT